MPATLTHTSPSLRATARHWWWTTASTAQIRMSAAVANAEIRKAAVMVTMAVWP